MNKNVVKKLARAPYLLAESGVAFRIVGLCILLARMEEVARHFLQHQLFGLAPRQAAMPYALPDHAECCKSQALSARQSNRGIRLKLVSVVACDGV